MRIQICFVGCLQYKFVLRNLRFCTNAPLLFYIYFFHMHLKFSEILIRKEKMCSLHSLMVACTSVAISIPSRVITGRNNLIVH